jgi:D-alanyl-lipoteichoic acid acyltransferase DltB (MBOAT superfamily)
MTPPSLSFFAFVLATAVLYHLPLPGDWLGAAWRKSVVLVANVWFLWSFAPSPIALLPFAAFLTFGYAAIRFLQRSARPSALSALALLALIGFLWLKKYSFFPEMLLLQHPYVTIGLSYVFFRVMHLVVDAGQKQIEKPVLLLDYLGYTLNFLCLISGPIQRYEDYMAQQENRLPVDAARIMAATERVALGVFKIVVLATLLSEQYKLAVAAAGLDPSLPGRMTTTAEIVLIYPLNLYANFSGYCDIVIGLGYLFGWELPENFDRPFASENFLGFWSRWHITLSNWLKTYVYMPLIAAILRRTTSRDNDALFSAFAYFVTFFLVGAWHGPTTEFLFFGLLQGGGVAANKLYQVFMTARLGRKTYRALCADYRYRAGARGLTFVWFGFTLIWFCSDWTTIQSLAAAVGVSGAALGLAAALALACVALTITTAVSHALSTTGMSWKYVRVVCASAQMTAVWLLSYVLAAPTPDIIYKAF